MCLAWGIYTQLPACLQLTHFYIIILDPHNRALHKYWHLSSLQTSTIRLELALEPLHHDAI